MKKDKHVIKFEYIISALGMIRMYNINNGTKGIVNQYLNDIDFNLGFLFNALNEPAHGKHYYKQFNYTQLMSDSGGLQVTTLGLGLEETKQKQMEIYETQALLSDTAMIFDEMALKFSKVASGAASRVDYSNRFHIRELVQGAALGTANNIKKQIQVFDRLNSDTKIMLICQGNDLASYKEYAETIFNTLTPDEQKRIYGIAPSGASNGNGPREIFDMLYQTREFDLPDNIKKNIHLLGVGSLKAIYPLIYNPDYFDYVEKVTFDSTSASRKYFLDGFDLDNNRLPKDKTKTHLYVPAYQKILDRYKKYFEMVPGFDMTVETLLEEATYYSSRNTKDIWAYYDRESKLGSTLNFLIGFFVAVANVEDIMNNISEEHTKETSTVFDNIKTYDDYLYYKRFLISKYKLRSNKIKGVETIAEMESISNRTKVMENLF